MVKFNNNEKFREIFLEWADFVRKHYARIKGIHNLKFRPFQERAINALSTGKSTNIIAPPGFGKSLIQFIAHSFYPLNYNLKSTYTVPTNSLMISIANNFLELLKSIDTRLEEKVGCIKLFESFEINKQMLFMNTVTQYSLTNLIMRVYYKRWLTNLIGWFQLIQDELHFYMNDENIINALIKYDIDYSKHYPVIITSATQPYTMVKWFEKEKNWDIIFADPSEIRRIDRLTSSTIIETNNDTITNVIIQLIQSLSISKRNKAIIFLNTRVQAYKIYNRIISNGIYSPKEVILLTSEVPLIIRKHFEKELQREDSNIKLIISTQVAEVGIDNNAIKYVITQASPLDSLIQRAGRIRLNRKDGELYILYSENSHLPYKEEYIDITMEIIKTWDSNTWNKALIDAKWLSKQLDKIFGDKLKRVPDIQAKKPEIVINPLNFGMFLAYITKKKPPQTQYTQILKQFVSIRQQTTNVERDKTSNIIIEYGIINNAIKFANKYCGIQEQFDTTEVKQLLDKITKEIENKSFLKLDFKYQNIEKQGQELTNIMKTLFKTYLTKWKDKFYKNILLKPMVGEPCLKE